MTPEDHTPFISERPSPNFDERPSDADISILVLHYTGMETAEDALTRLCDPESKVSAHYTIDEDGVIFKHVDEAKRAWHAGVSSWRGCENVNDASIGIELVNPGHEYGYRAFPDAQMEALIHIAHEIIKRNNILSCDVIGHSDVAPERKQDPGELFDWARLARGGIGLWPRPSFRAKTEGMTIDPSSREDVVIEMQMALNSIGYGLSLDGLYGPQTEAVVRAFQRHYWQGGVTGQACPATISLIGHISGLAAVEVFQSNK